MILKSQERRYSLEETHQRRNSSVEMPSSSEIILQSMARDCREPECGAHQTNKDVLCVQDDELCVQNVLCVQDDVLCVQGPAESSSVGNGLGDSKYSYMRKIQVTPNDVADATAVCSHDNQSSMSLKSSGFRKSSMCLGSSKASGSQATQQICIYMTSVSVVCQLRKSRDFTKLM